MVQVATFSVWKYGFDSRWGDQAAAAVIRLHWQSPDCGSGHKAALAVKT